MHEAIVMIMVFVTSLEEVCCRRRITNAYDAYECNVSKCREISEFDEVEKWFNCRCHDAGWRKAVAECIPMTWLCDGWKDCSNGADEIECVCPPDHHQCGSARGGKAKYWWDQYNCLLLDDDHGCYNNKTKTEVSLRGNRCDGYIDYTDALDEKNCDKCPTFRSNYCSCNKPGEEFSCSGYGWTCYPDAGKCDGRIDCIDGSDEDDCTCWDASDICSGIDCFECFDDKLTISQTQLCDGVIDCLDLSDECLCENNYSKPICEEVFIKNNPPILQCKNIKTNCYVNKSEAVETAQCQNHSCSVRSHNVTRFPPTSSSIRCRTKFSEITAITCDGRPECKHFEDECSCNDPPSFCSDGCHDYYPLGDRYCDGIIDEAWKYINDSSCPKGFDEKSCPQRFVCEAGNFVSIDRNQVCNRTKDCEDGSDEEACMDHSNSTEELLFSSSSEMIESVALRSVFWLMAALIITGNFSVIFKTTLLLVVQKMSESKRLNYILILNLSLSDILMGIYLLVISFKSIQYSGYYGDIDYQWRTSLECSIIGSIAIISSETSCFIMTVQTAFRLYNVFNPVTARTESTQKWKIGIFLSWLVSFVLALLPILNGTSYYFTHKIWFSNQFTSNKIWKKDDVMIFACRLASLSNHSIETNGDVWNSFRAFLDKYFSEYSPQGEFGYYSETSICLPRIYVSHDDRTWVYSFIIITFNFVSFAFVAISYALIYYKTSHRPIQTSTSDKQSAEMQKRIARMIATDFACWIPICIMVYMKIGGVDIPDVVYIVTVAVLLPINSALNPLLYLSFLENCFKKIFLGKNLRVPTSEQG